MKKLVTGIICFFLSYAFFAQTINDNDVRMRQQPFLSSSVVSKLQQNNKVKVLRKTEFYQKIDGSNCRWYFVQNDNQYGWVFGKFINGIQQEENINTSFYGSDLSKASYINYDFSTKQFIRTYADAHTEIVSIKNERLCCYISDNYAIWLDPVDIRDRNGTAMFSDLYIYTPSKINVLFPEETHLYWYEGETGYLKATSNEKYLILDEGTSHIRLLTVLDLNSFKKILTGSYISSMKYNSGPEISFIKNSTAITGYSKAKDFIINNNAQYIQEEKNINEVVELPDYKNEYATYNFGELCTFNTESKQISSHGLFLYYISVE